MNAQVDLLIRQGLVFDGTGAEPFEADIGISAGCIAFIDKKVAAQSLSGIRADRIIDAKGLTVTPGFIDTHGHSDFTLLADPRAEGKISQGITTEINGNCGLSAAPLRGEAFAQREQDLKEYGIKARWSNFAEYFALLDRKKLSLNFVTLAGHGNIRACVSGYVDRRLTAAEQHEMGVLLAQSVRQGAIGLSTGLIYPPGIYSDARELVELARYCKNSIYTTHMRSEGDFLLESVAEALRIGRESGIKVHISHIKTSGKKNWHKIGSALSMIEKEKKRGVSVTCDRYPYIASSTDLDTVLPSWAYEGGAAEELRRLQVRGVRERIKREILGENPDQEYWENIFVSSVLSRKNKWMEGKSIAYIASRTKSEPVDLLLNVLVEEKLRIGAIFSSMSEPNLLEFLSLPHLMIGTDSSARSPDGPTHKGKPHPRGFGSFPRFLGPYVREKGLMKMAEAVHKITMLPARTFGIHKRGVLRKGAYADIVVFDQETIADRATFAKPFLRPKGIHYVIVNGVPVIWEGTMTGKKAGKILKRGGATGGKIVHRVVRR